MPLYTKESIQLLRDKIVLADVVGSYINLKRTGSVYKGLCPFHEEKTPSFMIRQGDDHYHCFGCSAHGDAIAFLMNFQRLGFTESLEYLAERFGVTLEKNTAQDPEEISRGAVKEVLNFSAGIYHYLLLHTEEGEKALLYLYERGITLDFIQKFQLGYALPHKWGLHKLLAAKKFPSKVIEKAGLALVSDQGPLRDFFIDRIMFPICDGMGNVIGFSARKFREQTQGGKYINSPETMLFKKSHVLFGLHHSRRQIMKEKKAIIVEGQIDCLRLIDQGFDYTVAGQGTAFGEDHVKELVQLGAEKVFLCLDGDASGREAAVKIGDLFQKKGVHVQVVEMPERFDPDLLLRQKGKHVLQNLLDASISYLQFLVQQTAKAFDMQTPSGKQQLVSTLMKQIQSWNQPVLIHESLHKLAEILKIPFDVMTKGSVLPAVNSTYRHLAPKDAKQEVDASGVLEADFLRLLLFAGEKEIEFFQLAKLNIALDQLKSAPCQKIYAYLLQAHSQQEKIGILSLAEHLDQMEEGRIIETVMSRKVPLDKADVLIRSTIKRILERNWLEERERIKIALHEGSLSEEKALDLAKQFDELKRKVPVVKEVVS